jgi:hypothetical protein
VLGANGALIVIELIVATLVVAACTKAVSDAYLDQPVDAAASLRFALRRLPGVLALYILVYAGLIIAFILLIIPGIWLYVAWSVAVPAMLIERLGPFRGLGRSRRLIKGRWWASAAVLIVASLMVTLIAGAIEALLIAVASLPSQPSLALAVSASTLSGIIATIVTREHPAAKAPRKAKTASADPVTPAGAGEPGERWDTSAVTPQEVAAVRRFLERRASLERAARRPARRRTQVQGDLRAGRPRTRAVPRAARADQAHPLRRFKVARTPPRGLAFRAVSHRRANPTKGSRGYSRVHTDG